MRSTGLILGDIFMRPFLPKLFAILVSLFILPVIAGAQQSKNDADMQGMPGMYNGQMQGMPTGEDDLITMYPTTLMQEIVRHGTSGTSAEPDSTSIPMLMTKKGGWMLM